jgi:hypothetical protein
MEALIAALVIMYACIVVLTKPWKYEKPVQRKTLESSKEDTKKC